MEFSSHLPGLRLFSYKHNLVKLLFVFPYALWPLLFFTCGDLICWHLIRVASNVSDLYADIWWHDYRWAFSGYRSWCKKILNLSIMCSLVFRWMNMQFIFLLQVNPVRAKELTNIRSAGKDENVKLSPPRLVCDFQLSKFYAFISFILNLNVL